MSVIVSGGFKMNFSVGIIIVSDRAAAGEREDECLPVFQTAFTDTPFTITEVAVVPDDRANIETTLRNFISASYQLIFTAGGTGCAPRDVTPEVTATLLDKPTPGVDEAIRDYSRGKSPYAVFSRACSGVAGQSFVINLPGSPKAVAEILEYLIPIVPHVLKLIAGEIVDCRKELSEDD